MDTANTNMLLEKRGDIIKKKRIQVGLSFKTTFCTPNFDRESLCSKGLFLILNQSHDAMYVVVGMRSTK